MTQLAIRQLSIGEIIDLSFTIYRRDFRTLFFIALATTSVPLVLDIYVASRGGLVAAPAAWVATMILTVVMTALATAATTYVVSEAYLGRPLGTGDALRRALPLLGQVIVLSFVSTFLAGLGLVLLIVPGIIIACGLGVATPALVLESHDAMKALGRSWSLTRGFRGKMFLLFLVLGIIIIIPSMGVTMIALLFSRGTPGPGDVSAAVIGATVASGLVRILVYPIIYCTLTVAYYDLRVRKEGFDLELLESGLQPA